MGAALNATPISKLAVPSEQNDNGQARAVFSSKLLLLSQP